ncbi:UbiX family flavin prenyltransferase [Trichloromonas sp.]|uniref:UbiX family flavin prenyltransferase n=1 Tax=Trichloromonas sp. TaxID=3069249 RepID=UPI002A3FC0C6|nr:flavin prenyltransferase UbiX [Trichloromonas sp.]
MQHIVVAITGASGSIYGVRLVEELLKSDCRVTLLVTRSGFDVLSYETGLDLSGTVAERRGKMRARFGDAALLDHYDENDLFAPIASGSAVSDGMVICPCSMGTAGRIAAGLANNLVERVADVVLKERRELLLVPRETPFNRIHLENLLRLDQAGARILPAMPAFYHRPQSIDELVDFLVGKILDNLRLPHRLFSRWGDDATTTKE